MSLIDFILNLAGLLLWLSWRTVPFDPLAETKPATLVGTLRRAAPPRMKRWHFLVALTGLILVRALLYWQLGSALNWTAGLNLIATELPFQSDFLGRMLIFSVLSFSRMLAILYLWLLLLSMMTRGSGENAFLIRHARVHLGRVDGWSWPVKLLLPFLAGTALWWLLSWVLAPWGLMPHLVPAMHRLGQGALVGLSTYLAWKYLVTGLLALHLVNNYVYFGNHPLWSYVNATARKLLAPVRWVPLRVGKMDFAPVLVIALILLFTNAAKHGLRPPANFDEKGRVIPPAYEIPGLADLYRRISR